MSLNVLSCSDSLEQVVTSQTPAREKLSPGGLGDGAGWAAPAQASEVCVPTKTHTASRPFRFSGDQCHPREPSHHFEKEGDHILVLGPIRALCSCHGDFPRQV